MVFRPKFGYDIDTTTTRQRYDAPYPALAARRVVVVALAGDCRPFQKLSNLL